VPLEYRRASNHDRASQLAAELIEQQVAVAERRRFCMFTRLAVVLMLLAAGSARAEVLSPEAARRFVAGKLFAFNCFDGSRGAGRIYGDGSVIGTVQFRGTGSVRAVWLPAGTLRVRGEAVCASLQGMAFEPCFHLEKIDARSFRGSWMGFAYCDFTRRMSVAGMSPSEPLSIR
jgi:hypothetical protein